MGDARLRRSEGVPPKVASPRRPLAGVMRLSDVRVILLPAVSRLCQVTPDTGSHASSPDSSDFSADLARDDVRKALTHPSQPRVVGA